MTVAELIEALGDAPDEMEVSVIFERLMGDDIQEAGPFVIDNVDVSGDVVEVRCQEPA